MYSDIVSAFNTPEMVHHIQYTDPLPVFFSMFGGVFPLVSYPFLQSLFT